MQVNLFVFILCVLLTSCQVGSPASARPVSRAVIPIPIQIPVSSAYFTGYYPEGCSVNNKAAGIVGTCECIQDPVTKDIWLTTVNNEPLTWGLMFTWARYTLNAESTCGITNWSWNLAGQTQLNTLQSYIKTNSAPWLNNNGFNNIEDITYWGMELKSGDYPHGTAWIINMSTGKVDDIPQWQTYHAGLAVASPNNF